MTHTDIIKSIRNKEYKPVYFIHGEESFFIDEITNVFENEILDEASKSFNYTVMYGKDSDFRLVRDNATRFPMMSTHQLVILKEAQEMKSLKELKAYVEKPSPTTILLICHKHKKYDMRSALGKALKANAVVFEAKKLYDNEIPKWLGNHIGSLGFSIEDDALDLLTEHLGTNLSKISNELEKLSINIPKGSTINTKMIQDNIGISKDYNVFELQEALGSKDSMKTHRIVNHFASNSRKYPLMMTLASLYGFFSKLYIASKYARLSDLEMATALGFKFRDPNKAKYAAKFRVAKFRASIKHYPMRKTEKILSLLHEYDLKYKGVGNVNSAEGELLKEMVIRILAV